MSVDHAQLLQAQADALRRSADALSAQASMLREEFAGLPSESLLRGRAIGDACVAVLKAAAPDGMHYRELLARIEQATNMYVAGAKPSATLLAALHRDERVVMGDGRSGIVHLARRSAGEGEQQ